MPRFRDNFSGYFYFCSKLWAYLVVSYLFIKRDYVLVILHVVMYTVQWGDQLHVILMYVLDKVLFYYTMYNFRGIQSLNSERSDLRFEA